MVGMSIWTFSILYLLSICVMLAREYEKGTMAKPWWQWVIFAACFILPWLVFIIGGMSHSLKSLVLLVPLAYAILLPVRTRLFGSGVLGSNIEAGQDVNSRTTTLLNRAIPRVYWEMMVVIMLGTVSTVAFTVLFLNLGYAESMRALSATQPKDLGPIVTICLIWALPSLAFAFVAELSFAVQTVWPDILSGLLVGTTSMLIIWAFGYFSHGLLFMLPFPVLGAYLGWRSSLYVSRQKQGLSRSSG